MILQSVFLVAMVIGGNNEPMDPYFAQQQLSGKAWTEWAIAWNKQQYSQARLKRRPPIIISGTITTIDGTQRSRSRSITTDYRDTKIRVIERRWQIGGYGGGPVHIFNPFVNQ